MRRSFLGRAAGAVFLAAWLGACGASPPAPEPTLAPPPVDPRLRVLGQGVLTLDLAGGSSQTVDPGALARAAGLSSPCQEVVFLFAWRVRGSGTLKLGGRLADERFAVDSGRAGQASVNGCILLEAVNEGKSAVSGDLRYFIAEVRR